MLLRHREVACVWFQLGCILLFSAAQAGLAGADDESPQPREDPSTTSASQQSGTKPAAEKSKLLLSVPRDSSIINVDPSGNKQGRLKDVPEGAMEPAWSADGSRLAYVRLIDDRADIFVLDVKAGTTKNITKSDSDDRMPAWSPDGDKLAFMSDRNGDYEIFVTDPDGGTLKNLTNDEGLDADPAWSPDGKKILFSSMRDGQDFAIFVMNADGSEPLPLVSENLIGWVYPEWSPDGKRIAFGTTSGDPKGVQLMILDLETKSSSVVTQDSGINSFARWSGDGRYIAYVRLPERNYDPSALGADLIVYDTAKNEHKVLFRGDLPLWGPRPSWLPQP